jgi:hypothetical protein
MKGTQHYTRSEQKLSDAYKATSTEDAELALRYAEVHAKLALVAATAFAARAGINTTATELDNWAKLS